MFLYPNDTPDKKERLLFVTKDENGNKKHKFIKEPKFSFYVTKDEYRGHGPLSYIEKDKVQRVVTKRKDVNSTIANYLSNANIKAEYERIMKSGNKDEYKKLRDIHLDPEIHGSDVNIEDYFIGQYIKKQEEKEGADNSAKLHKVFFDIEVDPVGYVQGFPDPEEALAPINVISASDLTYNKVYVFALRYDTDTYRDAMSRQEELIGELKDKYKAKGLDLEFIIHEYDTELEVIWNFLDLINNKLKPDFCVGFN